MIDEKEIKSARKKKDGILKGNKERMEEIKNEMLELDKQRENERGNPTSILLKFRKLKQEMKEIKKRNVKLVNTWLNSYSEYKKGNPKKLITMKEAKKKLMERGEELEEWRLEPNG